MLARKSILIVSLVIVGAGIAAAVALRRPAPAPDFVDALTGPDSPQLDIPFDKYALTPEGLLRIHSTSGRGNGRDRPVVRTRSGAYFSRDFVFEIDVTVAPDEQDIVFVGLGSGDPEPGFNEPSGAVTFRLHQLIGIDQIMAALIQPPVEGQKGANFFANDQFGKYRPGERLTLRLEHTGDAVTLSLPQRPGAVKTYQLSAYPAFIDARRAYLFFANTAEGTVFSNMRVRPRG